MADSVFEVYNELDTALHHVECLLHGAYATAEFWSDKKREVGLLALAQDILAEAQELATQMYKAHRKTLAEKAREAVEPLQVKGLQEITE